MDRSASSPIGTSSPAPLPMVAIQPMCVSARSARPTSTTVSIDTTVDEVIRVMSDTAVRRVPVTDGDKPIGIVAIGDLAIDRDRSSLLGDISAAPPNS